MAADYQAVRKALMDCFESVVEPEENVRQSAASRLENIDFLGSLNEMDRRF